MKKLLIILFLILPSSLIYSQGIEIINFIGKTNNDVLKAYGKPVHKDNSIPSMISWFYQNKGDRFVFVSDDSGIYQTEACLNYSSIEYAKKIVDQFISDCVKDGFSVDTLSENEFHLQDKKISTDLFMIENKVSKKIVVNIKGKKFRL